MKIEALEQFRHERDIFEAGDIRTVPDGLGEYFCRAGWARDVDGKIETAPRDTHRVVTLDVNRSDHSTAAGDANG